MDRASFVQSQVRDARARKVVFLSHCILNENARYLGGASSAACVQPIVQQCLDNQWGIVQMPCPEQRAWGGVLKRLFIYVYGSKDPIPYRLRSILLPAFIFYTRWIYRRLARRVAEEIADYQRSGFLVAAVAGIDGSPSCGVTSTLDLRKALPRFAALQLEGLSVEITNRAVRESLASGEGMFTTALRAQLESRALQIPYVAHDLVAELS